MNRGYYGKEVTVRVTFRQDRNRDGLRLAKIRNCDEPEVENALMSCMPLVNDNPCKVIVKHSAGYIIKQKTKSFLKRTRYICKAIKKACSKDFDKITPTWFVHTGKPEQRVVSSSGKLLDDDYTLKEIAGHPFLTKRMNLPGDNL